MAYIRTTIKINNPRMAHLPGFLVKALIGTGSVLLFIPDDVKGQLKLEELEKRVLPAADGKKRVVSYVGPVRATFKNNHWFVGALALCNDGLSSPVPLEVLGFNLSLN